MSEPLPRIMERSSALALELGPGWEPLCECCEGAPTARKGSVCVSLWTDGAYASSFGDVRATAPLSEGPRAAVVALAAQLRATAEEVMSTVTTS